MGLKRAVKKEISKGYNVKSWLGYSDIKRSGRTVKD